MQERICFFCKRKIEPGTGKMFVKRNGTIFYLCSSKCDKNMLGLGRNPLKVKWVKKSKV